VSKKRLTPAQSDTLAEAVRNKLGIVQYWTANGLGSASKRRMFNRLCVVGLLREYPHGGYEITPAGREAFLQNAYDACIDCDGNGRYPSGAACKSCEGSGRVLPGDGIRLLHIHDQTEPK
jgi:hypothetical protein